MKKTYINPAMEIYSINAKQQLLAGSDPNLGGEYGGGTVLSRDKFFDFDEE